LNGYQNLSSKVVPGEAGVEMLAPTVSPQRDILSTKEACWGYCCWLVGRFMEKVSGRMEKGIVGGRLMEKGIL
jgi:hypothetical protein